MGKIGFAGGKVGMEVPVPPVTDIALGSIAEGSLVKINENGSPVEFFVAKHDYESALNGTGRTLLVRKDVYKPNGSTRWGDSHEYSESYIDSFLNSTYKALLSSEVQSAIGKTKFYYTTGSSVYNAEVVALSRSVFTLSVTEVCVSDMNMNGVEVKTEGSLLPTASLILGDWIVDEWGFSSYDAWWTRTIDHVGSSSTINAVQVKQPRYLYGTDFTSGAYYRPCFTLPTTALFDEETLLFKGVA